VRGRHPEGKEGNPQAGRTQTKVIHSRGRQRRRGRTREPRTKEGKKARRGSRRCPQRSSNPGGADQAEPWQGGRRRKACAEEKNAASKPVIQNRGEPQGTGGRGTMAGRQAQAVMRR